MEVSGRTRDDAKKRLFNRSSHRAEFAAVSDPWIAFLFHGPGLKVLRGYRMPTRVRLVNAAAIALTFALAGVAFFGFHDTPLTVTLWLSGHFGWSAYLAWYVSR